MGLNGFLRALGRLAGLRRTPDPPRHVAPGTRVRLRTPLASRERIWIPAGAAGIVVGWDAPARRVSVELDKPRTVITIPWSWIEDEAPEGEPVRSSPAGPD